MLSQFHRTIILNCTHFHQIPTKFKIVVSNTYCIASISGLSIIDCPF